MSAPLATLAPASLRWTNPQDLTKRLLMKNYDSRTVSINDFVEWDRQNQLELNPSFQRRQVWSDKAKSYLIDTILRGKPIPKIFIRQKLNVSTKFSVREVVDGQQRLRTILSFVKDGFAVSARQNKEFGGLKFSQLSEEAQSQVLNYEVSIDLLINLPNAEVLDIFSRLNSYAIVLNEQEKINANHFSEFKILADNIGYKYNSYWTKQGILTDGNILRMQEVNLVADLLIAMLEGIKSKKQIKKYYDQYEEQFEGDVEVLARNFDKIVVVIDRIFPDGLKNTEFSRNHIFYSLFTAVAHSLVGLKILTAARPPLSTQQNIEVARNGLDRVGELFAAADITALSVRERQFIQDSRRATTDEAARRRRTEFLLALMV